MKTLFKEESNIILALSVMFFCFALFANIIQGREDRPAQEERAHYDRATFE